MSAVVMLSGGQDSTTCLAMASLIEDRITAISMNYEQTHIREIICAKHQAGQYAQEHLIVDVSPKIFGDRPLLSGKGIPAEWNSQDGPAPTIVPGRNAILASIGAAAAEARGYRRVYLGVSAVDYSGYPDCRPEFIVAIDRAVNISSQGRVQLVTPLLNRDKVAMLHMGTTLGVDWAHTWTCYRGKERACGQCPACQIRVETFKRCGMKDPLEYSIDIVWGNAK
jgi:7-cyano-7-deazaguanine synthase